MDKLGIDLRLLVTQIVNFTIMLVILTKLLYKPILTSLKERQKKIEAGLAAAESAKQELEKLHKRKEEILLEAREEARVIMGNAQNDGKRIKDDIIAEGRHEIDALKQKMESELKTKFDEMATRMVTQTVDIATEMVKRLLPNILTDEQQHQLIATELKKIEKKHAK